MVSVPSDKRTVVIVLAVLFALAAALTVVPKLFGIGDADGFECPADIVSVAIPEGDFSPNERTAVVVREVDFRDSVPGVFYYVQFVEVGQTLEVGKDVNGPSQNRDAWEVGNDIQNASCVAARLALADAEGNIPNAVVWLQVECPREEVLQQARDAGLTLKDWNPNDSVENWFIQVTAAIEDRFVIVCDASQPADMTVPPTTAAPATTSPPATTPTTTAAPATTSPPATTPTTTVPPPAKPTCDVVMDAKTNQVVPKGTLVLLEIVDFSRRTITLEVKTLEADTPESVKGSLHTNLWWGYCSEASAREGLESQFAERSSEAAIPGSWADGFTVTKK